jgi:mitochondrial import receptor subunit TOM40
MFVSAIPNPGPYEQAAMEAKRLVSVDTFDGMRFDISKQLSPYMAVVHSFWLGTSMIPDGRNKSYSFITQVVDEAGLLFTRIDFDRGSVDGRIHRALLGGLAMGKLQLGVSQEGQQDQCLAELDFGGLTWTGNLKYGSMGGGLIYGCNYLQSITPNLAMGGEGLFVTANNNLMSNFTVKYKMAAKGGDEEEDTVADAEPTDSRMGRAETPSSLICANYNGGQDTLTLNYKRVVTPNRVTLGAELSCSPSTLQSQVLVGAEFKLTRSKVAIVVDGDMRIQSTVEAKLGMGGAPTIQFAGELDHLKNVLRFGYGLNIEG